MSHVGSAAAAGATAMESPKIFTASCVRSRCATWTTSGVVVSSGMLASAVEVELSVVGSVVATGAGACLGLEP